MKQIIILSLLVFTLFLSSCKEKKQETKSNVIVDTTNKIEVIDFYGKHRCVTCKEIEANAKYTVDTFFAEEQKKGIVVFKTVNVDDDANYKMAEAYEASGTALFLNIIKDGKETHINLTDFGFSKGREQETFSNELKAKIEAALKKL